MKWKLGFRWVALPLLPRCLGCRGVATLAPVGTGWVEVVGGTAVAEEARGVSPSSGERGGFSPWATCSARRPSVWSGGQRARPFS